MADSDFDRRYGPWALIAGASEGVGESVAKLLGDRGVNVVLVGRNKARLDKVGASLASAARSVVCDLDAPDAADRLIDATADLGVGLLVYNAGASGCVPPRPFLGSPVGHWQAILSRNSMTVVTLAHHFGAKMVARGRGGIVLVGSTACWAGTENMALYCATKAFQRGFAESLWAEFAPSGVDVLGMILGPTDTPAFRRLLGGAKAEGAADCDAVARDMFEALGKGPIWPPEAEPFGRMSRREAVLRRNDDRTDMFEGAQ